MRAKIRHKSWLACSLIVLFAVLLFSFALAFPAAVADSPKYFEADVTVGETPLSAMLTAGRSYTMSFDLYAGDDGSAWTKDTEHQANFEVKIYDSADKLVTSAIKDVGEYVARVVAKSDVAGYRTTAGVAITAGVVVAEKHFSVVKDASAAYLDADVTLNGDEIPSALTYTGDPFAFDFSLYTQQHKDADWARDTMHSDRSKFVVKVYESTGKKEVVPQAVGSYSIRIVAKGSLGYVTTQDKPINSDVIVKEVAFNIVRENLSLNCPPIDGEDSFALDRTYEEYAWCSETKGTALEEAKIRVNSCDCNVLGEVLAGAGATTGISDHTTAQMSDSTVDAFDDLSEKFSALLAKRPSDDWVMNESVDEYTDFFASVKALFALTDCSIAKGVTLSSDDGAIFGLSEDYTIRTKSEDSQSLVNFRTAIARLLGYDDTETFLSYSDALASEYAANTVGASSATVAGRLKYDGAVYAKYIVNEGEIDEEEKNSFILPYIFKNELVSEPVFACVILDPDGNLSVWLSDVEAAFKSANLGNVLELTDTSAQTDVYGRCLLFEIVHYYVLTSSSDLFLGGIALDKGADYTLAVEFFDGSDFSPVTAIDNVGTYRLAAKIVDSVLSDDLKAQLKEVDELGTKYYMFYREFSVTRTTFDLSLNLNSIYEDRIGSTKVTLSSGAALTAFNDIFTVDSVKKYDTQVIRLSASDQIQTGDIIATQTSGILSFAPTAAGEYLYRVIFTKDFDTYGIKSGSYIDLPFTVKATPYTVKFKVGDNGAYFDDVLYNYTGKAIVGIKAVFLNNEGKPIKSVYDGASEKFTVVCSGDCSTAGVYTATVTFTAAAKITDDYTIPKDTVLPIKIFRVVTTGNAKIKTVNASYTGSAVTPTITFSASGLEETVATEKFAEKYTVAYYTSAGVSVAAADLKAVGNYYCDVTITEEVKNGETILATVGAVYRSSFSIVYPALIPSFNDDKDSVSFKQGNAAVVLPTTLAYYEKTSDGYKILTSKPTALGAYLIKATFGASDALALYGLKSGDFVATEYSLTSALDWNMKAPSALTYNGGVIVPQISFSDDSGKSVDLVELKDYQVSYYLYDSEKKIYEPSGYPILAGTYKARLTFLTSDEEKGSRRATYKDLVYEIKPLSVRANFTISQDSLDLVYDGADKTFDIAFTKDDRPYALSATVEYSEDNVAYRATPYRAAGSYYCRATLADDFGGSLLLTEGGVHAFTIEALQVRAQFVVPVSYNAMWTGDNIQPSVTYSILNSARFDPKTNYTEETFPDAFTLVYTYTGDKVDGDAHNKTGSYKLTVSCVDTSVTFKNCTAKSDAEAPISISGPEVDFSILPRAIKVIPSSDKYLDAEAAHSDTNEKGFFYTGSTEADRKGWDTFTFMPYNASTGYDGEAETAISAFLSDTDVKYYSTNNAGEPVKATESDVLPTDIGYYIARITLKEDLVGAYITDGCYTFIDGRDKAGASLVETDSLSGAVTAVTALSSGCYVDCFFRIQNQNKLELVYDFPSTFAENGQEKVITPTFRNSFSDVLLQKGEGKDYTLAYYAGEVLLNAAPTEAGEYSVQIVFEKDLIAYRLDTAGYTKAEDANPYHISKGDSVRYNFSIFKPHEMTVSFGQPDSFYYDGKEKAYSVSFRTQDESGTDCNISLIKETNYTVKYFKQTDKGKTEIADLPVDPGTYVVQIEFLSDLPDYKLKRVLNGSTVQNEYEGDALIAIRANRVVEVEYTVEKAILFVDGVVAVNKYFDGTKTARFEGDPVFKVYEENGVPCGALNHEFTPAGEISGEFASPVPGEGISIKIDKFYTLPAGMTDYYELPNYLRASYYAKIFSRTVVVVPVGIVQEYSPESSHTIISYTLTYSTYPGEEDMDVQQVFRTCFKNDKITFRDCLTGALARDHADINTIGNYAIKMGTLKINDAAVGTYEGAKLSDIFSLELASANYRITERPLTFAVGVKDEESEMLINQSKIYGDEDPEYHLEITGGSLIYNHRLIYTATRVPGENAGSYTMTISNIRIETISGMDVSKNYSYVSELKGVFEIKKRVIKVDAGDQVSDYFNGFDSFAIQVIDPNMPTNKQNQTSAYVTDPVDGKDRLAGKLVLKATDDPLKWNILLGRITVIDAAGKDVKSNYQIKYGNDNAGSDTIIGTYTVVPIKIEVTLNSGAILQKYYGEKDPVILFDISAMETAKLHGLTLSGSIGRTPAEGSTDPYFDPVGAYSLCDDNSAGTFFVTDKGKDVTEYFDIKVGGNDLATKRFRILQRSVTVTIKDETYENANVGKPMILYLNENGTKVSEALLKNMIAEFSLPEITYVEGENLVTPKLVKDDNNFAFTLKAGTITMVYLQNQITATPVSAESEIYEGRKYILSGAMLYKAVKVYRLETADGEQPTHSVDIALPIDDSLKGDGLVIVALYADSSTRAFSFVQSEDYIIYSDDAAYYAVISEVQDWFYIVWGAVIIAAAVALYFLILLLVKLIKKHLAKKASDAANAKSLNGEDGSFVPTEEGGIPSEKPYGQTPSQRDGLFSSDAISENVTYGSFEAMKEEMNESTDHLFSDDAPVLEDEPVTIAVSEESESVKAPSGDELLTSSVDESVENVAEEPKEEDKGKKKKSKKKDKSAKSENAPVGVIMPKGFVPKGDKSAAYAPTRSYKDDLFIEEDASEKKAEDDLFADNNTLSEEAITIPDHSADASADSADDEIIVSRSGGFDDDLDEESHKGDENDLI